MTRLVDGGATCGLVMTRDRALSAYLQRFAGSFGPPSKQGTVLKVLVHRVDLTVRHKLECRPWHNLKQIAIERRVQAIRCDCAGAIGVDVVDIHAGSHYLRKIR